MEGNKLINNKNLRGMTTVIVTLANARQSSSMLDVVEAAKLRRGREL